MTVVHWLTELLFPRKCLLCQGILPREQSDLCLACRQETPQWEKSGTLPGLDRWTALWYYDGPVRESLLRYKFRGKHHYARGYGRLLAMQTIRTLPQPDLVTWVPISPDRKRERGYDQSELLARALAGELELPAEQMLRKVRNCPAQSGISSAAKRQRNVKHAYQAIPNPGLSGKQVLLVDDILTTGATAGECARVLRSDGAKEVYLAVIAAGKEQRKHTAGRR